MKVDCTNLLLVKNFNTVYIDGSTKNYKSMVIDKNSGCIVEMMESDNPDCDLSNTEIIDLNGKFVMPGMIDAHIHLYDGGIFGKWLDLSSCKNIDDMILEVNKYKKVKDYDSEWIIGFGFTDEAFGGKDKVNISSLDLVENQTPLIIMKAGGHSALINSKALEKFPVENILDHPEVTNDLLSYKDGKFSGEVSEVAMKAYMEMSGANGLKPSYRQKVIKDTIDYLLSHGVTSVLDITYHDWIFEDYKTLRENGDLKLRIRSLLYGIERSKRDTMIRQLDSNDESLKIVGSKYFTDGSISSYTAYLKEPYHGSEDGNRGILCVEKDNFEDMLKEDSKLGLQSIVHCIGDGAIDFCLNSFENSIGDVRSSRARIEHSTILDEELMEKIKRLKPVITYQQGELTEGVINMYRKRLGDERIHHLDEVRFMIDNDINVAFSSDWPYINPPEPFNILDVYMNQNKEVSVNEMLNIYTKGNAKAMFDENLLGELKNGYKADFIVLNTDPVNLDFSSGGNLSDIIVEKTFVGGREVYKRDN